MATLYIVPTPIGNLKDITLRAIEVLNEVDIIAAEDTRNTRQLLNHFQIETSCIAHHEHNERESTQGIIKLLKDNKQVALVSDAGTPGISDPGFYLVRECVKEGIKVECLPGATAFVPALVLSGLPTHNFYFEGFLPLKKGRQSKLKSISQLNRTIVLYESPHRLIKTLTQLMENIGENRQISVCRELSKLHEETKRGSIKEVLDYFTQKPVKGEIVIVIEGQVD